MTSLSSTDDIPLPPSNPTANMATTIASAYSGTAINNSITMPSYPPIAGYPSTAIYTDPSYYSAYAMAGYTIPQVAALGTSAQDPTTTAALQACAVAGYPYYPVNSVVNNVVPDGTATTALNPLATGEKLSKKQRKKLAAAMAEAALANSAIAKPFTNEGKPSHQKDDVDDDPTIAQGKKSSKANNILPIWGNEKTMNLNPLLLTNIQNSPYFKVNLYALKTYHEVIDEIWYQVKHLEPWEKGSRRVGGQTGMCGSVRGVGAGGIVSTPFCILYKLYTLRLTRKQVVGLLKHKDSSYIRALGFLYIRYTQPPENLWDWFQPYLEDKETVDAKAGGGQKMAIGELVRHLLTKLEWFSTLFPRIPVPVQKDIETKLHEHDRQRPANSKPLEEGEVSDNAGDEDPEANEKRNENNSRSRKESDERRRRSPEYEGSRREKCRDRSREISRGKSHEKSRDKSRSRSWDRTRDRHSRYDKKSSHRHKSDKHRDY